MNRYKFNESLLVGWVIFVLLAAGLAYLVAGCAKPKPVPAEKGFTLERFDATGLKPDGCSYSHRDDYDDEFSYTCWYVAKDGTRWHVGKIWRRSKP